MIQHFIKMRRNGKRGGPQLGRPCLPYILAASLNCFGLSLSGAFVPVALADEEKPLALGEERIAENENEIANEMVKLIKQISQQRQKEASSADSELASGPSPHYHHRFNQVETLGCFEAEFEVKADLPVQLRQGLFSEPAAYAATLRFANASTFDDAEKDLRGLSIRVQLDATEGGHAYQTFLMNSHPVLFADTPETFLKFIRATAKGRRWWFFLNPFDSHFKSLWILFQARDHHASPFDVHYWTTTPSRFGGPGTAAKFSAEPCSTVQSSLPDSREDGYLQANMKKHLAQAPVCYRLLAQLQQDPEKQPIEDASAHWTPEEAPLVPVAEIRFKDQAFHETDAMVACEQEVFDPWQALPAHEPLGGMNRVRRLVYKTISKYRLASHGAEKSE